MLMQFKALTLTLTSVSPVCKSRGVSRYIGSHFTRLQIRGTINTYIIIVILATEGVGRAGRIQELDNTGKVNQTEDTVAAKLLVCEGSAVASATATTTTTTTGARLNLGDGGHSGGDNGEERNSKKNLHFAGFGEVEIEKFPRIDCASW